MGMTMNQSHDVYYFKEPDGIAVVRVLHASMDATQQFL
jgi:plasmid stabilization system protein ParE